MKIAFASVFRSTSPSGIDATRSFSAWSTRLVVLELAADAHRFGQRDVDLLFHFAVEVVADFLLRDLHLRLAGLFGEIVDGRDDLLDRGVGGLERFDDLLLGHFLCARFHHHQPVLAAGDDEVELALFALLESGVDDVLAVNEADAYARDRLLERNLRERERGGGAGNREHVGVVLLIGRQHQRDDLRLVAPASREQRPRRPIDTAARQHLLVGRLAFALEEPAGDAAGRVGVFAVVDRQREEVDPLAGVRGAAGRHQHDGIAVPDDDGAVGLLGQLAGFEAEGLVADREFAGSHKGQYQVSRLKSQVRQK